MSRRGPIPFEEYADRLDPAKVRSVVVAVLVIVLLVGGFASSFYIIQPEGQGVLKRFGKVIAIRDPGPHFKLPFGIDTVQFVPTRRLLKEEFGFRTVGQEGERTRYVKETRHRDESLMLTGDLKVIDVEWVVQYRIDDPNRFLHRDRDPRKTIRDISEAVMRRIVGNSLGSDVLTEKRVRVAALAVEELQEIFDQFELGIRVTTVELQDVTPPEVVKPAFNEVNQAEQDRERLINEAEKRRNQVLPRAEGQALQMVAEAQGYAAERVNRARGEAERFVSILEAYELAPEVTRQRLYLEMIEQLLPQTGRIIVTGEGGSAPLPLLDLGGGSITTKESPAAPRREGGQR